MLNHASFLHTTELESLATLCFRAFDGSNYEVRCCVAKLLGALIATTQQQPKLNQAGWLVFLYSVVEFVCLITLVNSLIQKLTMSCFLSS